MVHDGAPNQDWIEVNIDGLVGPTHHFGGLGRGNLASQENEGRPSNPREAALQGLGKMIRVRQLGIPQLFLPPCLRPCRNWLTEVGFEGNLDQQLLLSQNASNGWLSAANSSAFMWTANAATVSASCDSVDAKLHVVPANLAANLHRAMECDERWNMLRSLFQRVPNSQVHRRIPAEAPLCDEGAANHMRLSAIQDVGALHLFVAGPNQPTQDSSRKSLFTHPSRQTQLASQAVARKLRLPRDRIYFLTQSQAALDAGVFHNDVIATSHEHLVLHHELAFDRESMDRWQLIERDFRRMHGRELIRVEVKQSQLGLSEAVASYLFNSQILTSPSDSDRFVMLAPMQCKSLPSVQKLLASWQADPGIPIDSIEYVQLEESMAGGGGPACLRLRANLTQLQCRSIPSKYWLDQQSIDYLGQWINRWYPTRVTRDDLARIDFAENATSAILELYAWLGYSGVAPNDLA